MNFIREVAQLDARDRASTAESPRRRNRVGCGCRTFFSRRGLLTARVQRQHHDARACDGGGRGEVLARDHLFLSLRVRGGRVAGLKAVRTCPVAPALPVLMTNEDSQLRPDAPDFLPQIPPSAAASGRRAAAASGRQPSSFRRKAGAFLFFFFFLQKQTQLRRRRGSYRGGPSHPIRKLWRFLISFCYRLQRW